MNPDNSGNNDSTSVFNLDKGSAGIVIDTREIFRKGYVPVTAEVSFTDYSQYNATLNIDPSTCIAILKMENSDLSEDEKSSFAEGVNTSIEILDGSGTSLANYSDSHLELNDSNLPLILVTEKPWVKRPLVLKVNIPYLIQVENNEGILSSYASDAFQNSEYEIDNFFQQYYFVETGDENTYMIDHYGYSEGTHMYYEEEYDFFNLGGEGVPLPEEGPATFTFEQDDDGWIKIRYNGNDNYLYIEDDFLRAGDADKMDRFRIISDDIDWDVEDRGTQYNQPIMPPVKLDFAYNARLSNCSSASLSEEVGRTQSKTRTTTMETMESLQLFSSLSATVGFKIGVEVGAKVGADVEGIGEASLERKVSAEVSTEFTYTTSQTKTTANTFTESTTTTSEVSRVRTLELLPYTAVEVYDAIKKVDNVITPFIQTIRISGSYKSSGNILTGPELVTQMQFNFVGGVISRIESNFIEVTLRGQATMDEIFDATTEVHEIEGACDN